MPQEFWETCQPKGAAPGAIISERSIARPNRFTDNGCMNLETFLTD
jgi:hypothetical protein